MDNFIKQYFHFIKEENNKNIINSEVLADTLNSDRNTPIDFEIINKWVIENNKLNMLILGEPGMGKSRNLKELTSYISNRQKIPSVFIDAKNIEEYEIDKIIENKNSRLNLIDDKQKYFKIRSINKNKKHLICIDALDEVSENKLDIVLEKIKKYTSENTILIITTRYHIYQKNIYRLKNDFKIRLEIRPLDTKDIENLLKTKFGEHKTENILELFNKNGLLNNYFNNSKILNVPRYLNYTLNHILLKGETNEIYNLNRTKIFEKITSLRFNDEIRAKFSARKINLQTLSLFEIAIRNIALFFQLKQTSHIKISDFWKFIYNTELINIQNIIDIEILFNSTIFKTTNEYIEFDNKEIQEYLAASAILESISPIEILSDISFDKKTDIPYTFWINTNAFIIELDNNIAYYLLKKLVQNEEINYIYHCFQYFDTSKFEKSKVKDLYYEIIVMYSNKYQFIDYNLKNYFSGMFLYDYHLERFKSTSEEKNTNNNTLYKLSNIYLQLTTDYILKQLKDVDINFFKVKAIDIIM